MENVLSFFTTKHRKQKTLQKVHKKVIRGYTYMDYALLTPTSNIQTQRVMFPKSTCCLYDFNVSRLQNYFRGLIKPLAIPLLEKCLPTNIGLNNQKMFTIWRNTSR